MKQRGHETIEHTADMGIRGWGPTVEQAFEEIAIAMLELIAEGEGIEAWDEIHLVVEGESLTELLIAFLNRLLLDADIEELAFISVEIESMEEREGGWRLEGTAYGVPRKDVSDRLLAEVKAATYCGALVRKDEEERWTARCVVDM